MEIVLLIDNDPQRSERIRKRLERLSLDVLLAECVISGLELGARHEPDLILLSDALAGLEVDDFVELRSSVPAIAGTPIIVHGESSARKLEYLVAGFPFVRTPDCEEELDFHISEISQAATSRGLSGDFTQVSLVDLIQMFMAARSNGELLFVADGLHGSLVFLEGQIIHAEFEDQIGEDAFAEILRLSQRKGRFSFVTSDTSAVKKSIEKRTDHLLLNLANTLDEEADSASAA